MARRTRRPKPTAEVTLTPISANCPACGNRLYSDYSNFRNLLDRYDELLAVALADDDRLRAVLQQRGRVILAIDGLQPDVRHEVLWVLRDVLSGEILLAKSLLSARNQDLAALLEQVKANGPVPITGVVSDGQHSIRKAVAAAFPGGCRTSCASSTTCARPPGPPPRRIGTPRRN